MSPPDWAAGAGADDLLGRVLFLSNLAETTSKYIDISLHVFVPGGLSHVWHIERIRRLHIERIRRLPLWTCNCVTDAL